MRIPGLAPIPVLVLCVSAVGLGQTTSTQDATALAVLAQMEAATGWNPGSVPADVLVTGTVTRYQGTAQDTMTITMKAKGSLQYRTEVQGASGVTTTVVNDQSAAASTPQATRSIPPHEALSMRPRALPFYSDLIAIGDPNVALVYIGTETVNGQLSHRIEISRVPLAGDPVAFLRRKADHLTVWISGSTSLPVQIGYPRIAEDNATAVLTYVRQYFDYTIVQGLAVPLRQEEFAGTTHLCTVQLTGVSFNVGLPASDFAVPLNAQ
jgi:hypothetical protein